MPNALSVDGLVQIGRCGSRDDCRERYHGYPAWFNGPANTILPEFRNARFDLTGAGLSIALAAAIVLCQPAGNFLAMAGAC